MTELENSINKKEIPENENPEKIVKTVKKILNFNNQQKGKGRSRMLARVAKISYRSHPSELARITRVAKVSNLKVSEHTNLKILTPKQMLQRLPIDLAQVKAGNTSENLLNEIR